MSATNPDFYVAVTAQRSTPAKATGGYIPLWSENGQQFHPAGPLMSAESAEHAATALVEALALDGHYVERAPDPYAPAEAEVTPVVESGPATGLRAFTEDEVRQQFLEKAWWLARHWAGLDNSNVPAQESTLERITGFAHSLFAVIDGGTELPAFALATRPHPEDRAYCISEGENWYPDGVDIGGSLAGLMVNADPTAKPTPTTLIDPEGSRT